MDTIYDMFPDINLVKTENSHKISPLIEHEWVDLTRLDSESEGGLSETKELDLLVQIIKKS